MSAVVLPTKRGVKLGCEDEKEHGYDSLPPKLSKCQSDLAGSCMQEYKNTCSETINIV